MSHPAIEQLRAIDLFEGLPDTELARWADAAEIRELPAGALVAEQGQTVPAFHLVLEGSLEALAVDGEGRAEAVSRHEAPTWVGAIAVLTGGVSNVRMRALSAVVLADVNPGPFVDLVRSDRAVLERVLRQVRPVVGRLEAIEQNRERLAALGTMAAGLAHELNNPAAAARRAAADMADALEVLSSTIGHFVESGIERQQAAELVALQREALARQAASNPLDALDAADAEEELLAELESIGVAEPWRVSEAFAGAGLDPAWLRHLADRAGPAADAAVRSVAAALTARSLALELASSTEQISSLVGAVKAYAYMDRGELLEVDVHEGLETTLAVLAHKLRHSEITVTRNYDRSLPRLTVHAGELNQVWTNLIDNAIQVLDGRGEITITTAAEGDGIRVDIADDGPGIDAAIRGRIFDPFFTTKGVGEGTGLGLDTARRIVVERHGGSIDVESEAGRTVFHVWLPSAPVR